MKRLLGITITLLLLVASLAVAAGKNEESVAEKSFVLKYACVLTQDHVTSQAVELWADQLEKMSNGKIKVELYHAGSMGKTTEVIEYMQQGTVALSYINPVFLSGLDVRMDIFGLPYLFKDADHMYRACNSEFGEMIKAMLIDDGLRSLAFMESGSRSVYTKDKVIETPADMKGIKIRVMTKVAVASMNALGANGVPIPWGELYTSLQTGVVDAAENNPASILSGKHFEVCKYYSLTSHFRNPDLMVISEKVYQELPDDLKKILIDSIENYLIPTQREMFNEDNVKSMEELKELGMEISEISDLKLFIELTTPVREQVAKEIGMYDWVKKIEKM